MTEQETLEGNKLIAEFMTMEKCPLGVKTKIIHSNDLKYHSSWDWLMPVVEKIEKTHCINIEYTTCNIADPANGYEDIISTSEKTKIEATWKAVIEFINWYNKQGK